MRLEGFEEADGELVLIEASAQYSFFKVFLITFRERAGDKQKKQKSRPLLSLPLHEGFLVTDVILKGE